MAVLSGARCSRPNRVPISSRFLSRPPLLFSAPNQNSHATQSNFKLVIYCLFHFQKYLLQRFNEQVRLGLFSYNIYFFKVSSSLQANFTRQGYPIIRVNFTKFSMENTLTSRKRKRKEKILSSQTNITFYFSDVYN